MTAPFKRSQAAQQRILRAILQAPVNAADTTVVAAVNGVTIYANVLDQLVASA